MVTKTRARVKAVTGDAGRIQVGEALKVELREFEV